MATTMMIDNNTDLQSRAFDAVTNRERNVFITGPGGVGKSTITRKIIEHQRRAGRIVSVTATTGVAAILVGGLTIHSELGIGLGHGHARDLISGIANRKKLDVWRKTQLLVIDEISMLTADLLDKLELIARQVRQSRLPFGGIKLLLSGDFLQLPCINGEFCFLAKCWPSLQLDVFYLTEVKRQVDPIFQEVLSRARIGNLTDEDIRIMSSISTDEKIGEIKPTKILCKNIDVDRINMLEVKKLGAPIFKYNWKINVLPAAAAEVGHSFDATKYCNCQNELYLCVGAQVMLIVNLSQETGLVNGSRGVVVRLEQNLPVVKFAADSGSAGILIDWNIWTAKKNDDTVLATIKQIPLKLAYAITAHKSQGQTIDSAFIDLKDVFEYGQAYVALSRVKCLERLSLKNATTSSFKANPIALEYYTNLTADKSIL